MPESTDTPLSPYLAGQAKPRSGSPEIPGAFSTAHDVWMVDGPDGPMPIVATRTDLADTSTVTKVRVEQDDTDIAADGVMVNPGQQIQAAPDPGALLEMTTKTSAQIESDDVVVTIGLCEPREETLRRTRVPIH